jgi:GxxExxY protein
MTNEKLNEIGGIILDAAITVHRELGPGLLESAYQLALKRELELRGLKVLAKVPVELVYKEVPLGKAYEIDLLVEGEIIIENKSVEAITPIFTFQVITYLKLYHKKKLGYLINFNVQYLKDGFKRIVNNF